MLKNVGKSVGENADKPLDPGENPFVSPSETTSWNYAKIN